MFVFGVANFRFAVCMKTLFESVVSWWSDDLNQLHREAKQPKLKLSSPESILDSATISTGCDLKETMKLNHSSTPMFHTIVFSLSRTVKYLGLVEKIKWLYK